VRFTAEEFAGLVEAGSFVDLVAEHVQTMREQLRAVAMERLAERWAAEQRRYWSGPDRVQRRVLRAFRVSAADIDLAPRSAFSSEYRRRQRARVKRRRR
jgi:hypothetical protein